MHWASTVVSPNNQQRPPFCIRTKYNRITVYKCTRSATVKALQSPFISLSNFITRLWNLDSVSQHRRGLTIARRTTIKFLRRYPPPPGPPTATPTSSPHVGEYIRESHLPSPGDNITHNLDIFSQLSQVTDNYMFYFSKYMNMYK